MTIYDLTLFFFIYGFLGWCAEVSYAALKEHRFVNRGFLNGPICPIYGVGVTLVIAFLTPLRSNLLLLYVVSILLVTLLEGVTGWAMDKIFHNKWWDYSSMPFNIGGYVCLLFSLLWGVACVLIMELIHPLIQKGVEYLPHTLGVVLLLLLSIALCADTWVTASAIFRFNRHLAHMEKIAAELHEISDQIGADIYKRTITAIERSEQIREDIPAELRGRITDLYGRYSSLKEKRPHIYHRLTDAFPKMQHRAHRELLNELRRQWSRK